MKEGELLYFTPAEFVVMMELAGKGPYSMIRGAGPEPDDMALIQAFSSLFQREMIVRNGDGFELSGKGRPFAGMRSAQYVVLISAVQSHGFAAVCYVGKRELWLVELVDDLLSQRCRLQRIDRRSVKEWLFDAELLEPPALSEEDAFELGELFEDELSAPSGSVLLKLERHVNGGDLLFAYELMAGKGCQLVVCSGAQGRPAEIYTVEALSRMLAECFGKEST